MCDDVRNEAYLHTVRLVRNGQAEILGHCAHLRLFKAAEREYCPPYLRTGQTAEHIALVVGGHALHQTAVFRPGVVTCGDEVCAEPVGLGDQIFEFSARVADDARIRRLAAQI